MFYLTRSTNLLMRESDGSKICYKISEYWNFVNYTYG